MKTVNILGDSQREQWHSVVNMLRQLGGDLTYEGRSQLCDELDRYIDAMEDANTEENEPQKIYALTCAEYSCGDVDGGTMLFSSLDSARKRMLSEFESMMSSFPNGVNEWGSEVYADIDEDSAHIDIDADNKTSWNIAEVEINRKEKKNRNDYRKEEA